MNGVKRGSILLAASAALAVWTGTASAGLFDDEVARKQIVEQGRRIEEMSRQQDALAGRIARMEESAKGGQTPIFELLSQIEQLRQEIASLRGQLEVLGHNIDSTAKRQKDMYVDLDARMRRLEQAAASAPAPAAGSESAPAAPGSAPASGAAPAGSASSDETRAYEAAQNQRRIGNYQGAIAAFQDFIAKYPRSPLAHRAQYWVGDSYYNLREYKTAIQNQQKLIATYPQSTSVPDALLNIASSQIELGESDAAKKTLDGLITRYPSSEAAEKAKRRLANLR